MLTIGRDDLECDTFRVRGSYGKTIARLFALPVAVESTEPLTLEVTLKGSFRPPKIKRRVYWKKKFIGDFIISSVAQEWDGNKYRTRLELKQCDRTDAPDEEIPLFKWRHDLVALSQNLAETDGALIAAGRTIDPFANSWKLTTDQVASAEDDNPNPAVLPVSLGGTGASDPRIALLNLGGVDSSTVGLPFGVAPLGADGKISPLFLPPGSGGGGSSVTFPITIAQGGTNALDAATARANLGAISLADLPPFPTLGELGGVSSATFTAAIALKADTSAVASALTLKADISAVSTALGLKVDTSTYTAGLALKADTSALTAGLALKLDAATRNAANGVAGLDPNSLISVSQIPLSVQFQLIARTLGATVDLNNLTQNHASVRRLDSDFAHTNLPAIGSAGGTLLQYDAFFGIAGVTNLYKTQTYIGNISGRVADRSQQNGTWGTWFERAYLNKVQAFSSLQDFGAGATFKAGGIPAVTTTLTQAGVTAEGLPIYWFVNSTASAGNRLKSITIAANGNIQLRHHADDGTVGNIFEHTASGNILTNGTVRPGSGSVAFTGASFVPGSTYFRTDVSVGGSATGAATFSDGSEWLGIQGRNLIHQGSPNLDNFSNGWTSCDTSSVDGVLRGWHVCTSYRPNNSAFGIQYAYCDTTNGFRYRRKASGVWQAWATII